MMMVGRRDACSTVALSPRARNSAELVMFGTLFTAERVSKMFELSSEKDVLNSFFYYYF